MATTGATAYLYFQQKVGKPYSANIDPTKATRLFEETVYRAIEQKYEGLTGQKVFDELSVLLRSNRTFTPVNNRVSVLPALIQSVGNTAGLSPTITLVTLTPHHVKVGDTVVVAGTSGITYSAGSINGSWAVLTTANEYTLTYVATGANISGGTYNTGSGRVYNAAATILDYYHYQESKAKFMELLTPVITGVSIAADAIITTNTRHNLREGDNITIASVAGTVPLTTNINTTQTVTEIVNSTQFKVGKSTIGGTYTSGGTISKEHYNACVQYKPGSKMIAKFGEASYEYPRVEFVENSLLFYADPLLTRVCTQATVDYMSKPLLMPDMSNAIIDLEQYWSRKLIYLLLDIAADDFAGQKRDRALQQTQAVALRQNP